MEIMLLLVEFVKIMYLLVEIMKMILLVEGNTSRVADHIWGGCGPPSVYTESELNLENHRTFRKYKLNIEFQSNFFHLEGVPRDRGWWTALRKKI